MQMLQTRGSALILILLVTSILYLLGIALLLISFTEGTLSDLEVRSMQSFYLAESALAEGLAKLRTNPDYRTDLNDTFSLGGNVGLYSVAFYDGTNDGNGHYLSTLSPSLYQIILEGRGVIPGPRASTRTQIEAEVALKPFAILSGGAVEVGAGGVIQGNIHANAQVTVSAGATVTGNVTTSGSLSVQGTVTGATSFLEPSMNLPVLTLKPYYPTYTYQGNSYPAQRLTHTSLALPNPPGNPPPYPSIELYQGAPSSGNPAAIYYLDEATPADPIQVDLVGTLIILPPVGSVRMYGAIKITPVTPFPAIISAHDLEITLTESLSPFGVTGNLIQGLVYTDQDLTLTGEGVSGVAVQGTLIAHRIAVQGVPNLQLAYAPGVWSNPPPDLDLIEVLSWKEEE